MIHIILGINKHRVIEYLHVKNAVIVFNHVNVLQ